MASPNALTIISPIYSRILSRFPQRFSFCFAYGSGVKLQATKDVKHNMIDLVYSVNNPKQWHEENLLKNSRHYSALKYLGPTAIARFQESTGAKVYFNTLVSLEGVTIKYGVISTKDLITDLLEWSDLYLAGRLHKPVEIIKSPSNSELQVALQLNLQSAIHASLLILPDTFTEYEFYHTICNLSYGGDFRMIFGENPNKVANIVKPQMMKFRNLYRPFLTNLTDYVYFPMLKDAGNPESERCSQDLSPVAKLHHLNQLPRWPQKALTRLWNRGRFRQDTEDVLRAIAYDADCNVVVEQCIRDIVRLSSLRQSLKGILTAGMYKSVKYASKKVVKMFHKS